MDIFIIDQNILIDKISNGVATPLPSFKRGVRRGRVIFPSFCLPLFAAVKQNLKVIIRKGINVENKEFKCISFADDLTCILHHDDV